MFIYNYKDYSPISCSAFSATVAVLIVSVVEVKINWSYGKGIGTIIGFSFCAILCVLSGEQS